MSGPSLISSSQKPKGSLTSRNTQHGGEISSSEPKSDFPSWRRRHEKPLEERPLGTVTDTLNFLDESPESDLAELESVNGLLQKLTLHEPDVARPIDNNSRFHGKSCSSRLVNVARRFKLMQRAEALEDAQLVPQSTPDVHLEGPPADFSAARPEFWHPPSVNS